MEISILSPGCIKIKGKRSSFIVDPQSLKTKNNADAVIFLKGKEDFNPAKVEEYRVIVRGGGEYEVAGVKISASRVNQDLAYEIQADGLKILLAKTSSVEKVKEKMSGYDVVILNADSVVDQSFITALEPKSVIFYGENSQATAGALSKEIKPVSKFTIVAEKLPAEMETILLQ